MNGFWLLEICVTERKIERFEWEMREQNVIDVWLGTSREVYPAPNLRGEKVMINVTETLRKTTQASTRTGLGS